MQPTHPLPTEHQLPDATGTVGQPVPAPQSPILQQGLGRLITQKARNVPGGMPMRPDTGVRTE